MTDTDPTITDLVTRLEKLELASNNLSDHPTRNTHGLVFRKGTGPYDPPVIPHKLSTEISEICQKGGAEEEEKEKLKVSTKLPLCELPKFSGQDFPSFLAKFARFLRLSGLLPANDQTKKDWLIQACGSNVYEIFEKIVEDAHADLEVVLTRLGEVFPALENDLTIRKKIATLPPLRCGPDPSQWQLFCSSSKIWCANFHHKLSLTKINCLHSFPSCTPKLSQKFVQKGFGEAKQRRLG